LRHSPSPLRLIFPFFTQSPRRNNINLAKMPPPAAPAGAAAGAQQEGGMSVRLLSLHSKNS
jgi:hypothetical protein